jgi:predicted tellurium resistance membrane protein TerC
LAAKPINDFVSRHPNVKTLAFPLLILVGVVLTIGTSHRHISSAKSYIDVAMAVLDRRGKCSTCACASARPNRCTCTRVMPKAEG